MANASGSTDGQELLDRVARGAEARASGPE
jgi:hypothetical protein